jgi:hypothetical protein
MCELKITNSCRERSPALIGNNTNDSLMFQVQLVSWMTTDENLISIDSCLASLSCKLCQFQRKPLLDIIRPTWEWDHLPRVLEREGPAGQKLIQEFVLVGTRVTVWWLLFLFCKDILHRCYKLFSSLSTASQTSRIQRLRSEVVRL